MGSVAALRIGVHPRSRSPAAGASARRPEFAWPMGWPLSRSFGGYAKGRRSLGWGRGHCPAFPLA